MTHSCLAPFCRGRHHQRLGRLRQGPRLIFGLAPLWSIAVDDIHRATQGSLLRRRLRRPRSTHRQRTPPLAPRGKQPHRSRRCRRPTRRRTHQRPTTAWRPDRDRDVLSETWLPQKRRQVRTTTAYRYAWFIQHYVNPAIGHVPLRRLRADHLDTLYETLATTGGKHSTGLAHKTVHEVHVIIRAALELSNHIAR